MYRPGKTSPANGVNPAVPGGPEHAGIPQGLGLGPQPRGRSIKDVQAEEAVAELDGGLF